MGMLEERVLAEAANFLDSLDALTGSTFQDFLKETVTKSLGAASDGPRFEPGLCHLLALVGRVCMRVTVARRTVRAKAGGEGHCM